MDRFNPFNLPVQKHAAAQELADSVMDIQAELENSLDTVHNLDVFNRPPSKLETGMLRYADGVGWNPGNGAGVYYFDGNDWHRLTNVEEVLQNFVAVGYGGVNQPNPGVVRPDLGAGWQTVSSMTEAVLATPRYVTQSTGNSSLYLLRPGVWQISLFFTFDHNTSNSGRVMNVRIRNASDNEGSQAIAVGVGRNVEVTTFSLTTLFEIGEDVVGDQMRLQVGAGDTITDCVWNNIRFEALHVGSGADLLAGAP